MSSIKLYSGDNKETLQRLIDEGVQFHSVVTDPPYGLVSVQKRFGKEGYKAPRTEGNDGSFSRLSGGFMGKQWDGTGIERDPEFWKLVYDILLPGGYVFAFSGSRTGHWQACAMETVGFVMHPMHGWVFGTGFPKAHSVEKSLRKAGDEENADKWEGWSYGTQTQKPALEPIYLAQKPFSEKTGSANILKHGVGAVNIDGCRVPSEGGRPLVVSDRRSGNNTYSDGLQGSKSVEGGTDLGRHPANLILDGSPEVVAMFPISLGQQGKSSDANRTQVNTYGATSDAGKVYIPRNDSVSAARFFHQFPPDYNPVFYSAKAGKSDRAGSKHPTVKPVDLMRYLIRHITPPGGTVLDMFAGSGTTGEAAAAEGFDCVLMEAEEEYVTFLDSRFRDREGIVYEKDGANGDIAGHDLDDSDLDSIDFSGVDLDLSDLDFESCDTGDDSLDLAMDEDTGSNSSAGICASEEIKFDSEIDIEIEDEEINLD